MRYEDKYTFKFRNIKAWIYAILWRRQKAYGVYVISGKSGAGKTCYVKYVGKEKFVKYDCLEFMDILVTWVKDKVIFVPDEEIIIIEDIDIMLNKMISVECCNNLLKIWCDSGKKLILLTTTCSDIKNMKAKRIKLYKLNKMEYGQ